MSPMHQADLNTTYEKAKAQLNPEQRQAVETIEGPVMVLAGPGTGKTQVLAFRIAEILKRTDISPRNILALTFTESGVAAMRERLVSLIGIAAYGVGIYTFHSFANRVISESGVEFYKSKSLDPIDDITQLQLVIQLIDHTASDLLRPTRAPYFYVKPIISAIKTLKNEGVTPDKLRKLCQETIDNLQTDPSSLSKTGKTKGQLKQAVKDTITQMERTTALVDMFKAYEQALGEKGLYDYEDMILFVLNRFAENKNLKAKYQEQFHYILVDEYQDTNNAQNTLIRLLADYFDNPNVFVVGDDKQSIYRFQGASMANLLNFRAWYPSAQLISLHENYRSGQVILENAQALIDHNKAQLAGHILSLITTLHAQQPNGKVSLTQYTTFDAELLGVVAQIKQLVGQGVLPSRIALMYRENSEAADFTDLLSRQGLAFHLEGGDDILKDSDVRHLVNLLTLATEPDNEYAFFRYLHAPFSRVSSTDLVRMGRWRKQARASWTTLFDSPHQLTLESWPAITKLREQVEQWHRFQANRNLGETAEYILTTSGLLPFVMQQNDHLQRLHRLRCFFDEIKHIMRTVYSPSLIDLFRRLEIRETYNLPLIAPPLTDQSDKAIRLMTAHKSKGLEFDYVFMPHAYDGLWSNNRKHGVITLPEQIVPHHTVDPEAELEEERRLFYVALTRAKQAVFLSLPQLDRQNRQLLPCQFIAELATVTAAHQDANQTTSLVDFFSPIQSRFTSETAARYLQEIINNQTITPTGLNTYLTCPLEYLYKEIYCIPGVREPFQSFGTAVHKAVELWGNWSKMGQSQVSLANILSVFSEGLIKEGLTTAEIARYQALGYDILTAYWEQFGSAWAPPLAVEYSFTPHSVKLDDAIPITGKIDKIEPLPRSKFVRVTDFKTGRVKSRNEMEGKTASSDQDYKRQLVFYTVLAEADPFFPYDIGEAAIAFLDDQKRFTVESFVIEKQEKEELRELIRSVHKEITQLHFDHTPHKNQWGKGESLCDLLREDLGVKETLPLSQTVTDKPLQSNSPLPFAVSEET